MKAVTAVLEIRNAKYSLHNGACFGPILLSGTTAAIQPQKCMRLAPVAKSIFEMPREVDSGLCMACFEALPGLCEYGNCSPGDL